MRIVTADEARTLILSNEVAEEGIQVEGDLDLSNETSLTALPAGLRQAWTLDVHGCTKLTTLPDDLHVHRLNANDCASLETLPRGMHAYTIQAQRCGLRSLPTDLRVSYKLDLAGCGELQSLPDGLHVGSLIVSDCNQLESLPDGLHLFFLDASNCVSLKAWGETGTVEVGNINLRNCRQLISVPAWFDTIAELNVQGCVNLRSLPNNLRVTSTIELADSGLQALPAGCDTAVLRWRDVEINEQVAFHPETILAQAVMTEQNIELRRVMLERIGYETFFKQANAEELDRDADTGGVRRLLRVEFQDAERWQRDEPLVCLSVICPSTARHYIIRVPPDTRTCRQGAAWVAGFDNPDQYRPILET